MLVRHERRLRLSFTNTLAGGAFGTPAPAYYVVTNLDGRATSPAVASALIVTGSPAVVELALAADLCAGAQYKVSAVGVPAGDASVTPAGSEERFIFGKALTKEHLDPVIADRERLLYGVDLLWNGTDFQETSNADLERIEGRANVSKSLWRGVETSGLPWDRTWGVLAREYVDSPSSDAVPLRGAVVAQIMRDKRVRRVKTELEIVDTKTYLHLTPTLVTGEAVAPVSVTVPNDS